MNAFDIGEEIGSIQTELAKPVMIGYSSYLDCGFEKGQVFVSIQNYQIPALGVAPARAGIILNFSEWELFLIIADGISVASCQKDLEPLEKSYQISDELTIRLERPANVFLSKIVFVKNGSSFSIGLKQLRNILQMAYLVNLRIKQLQNLFLRPRKHNMNKRKRIEGSDESD